MIIGVMSDSHDNMSNVVKAMKLFRERGVNIIFHLGDIISPFIVKKMTELSWKELEVYAVFGNNDGDKMLLNKLFTQRGWSIDNGPRIHSINGVKILYLHGYNGADFTRELVNSLARGFNVDVILYGHTHRVDVNVINNKLVLNPGELYGGLSGRATIALLDINKKKAEIIDIT